MQFNAHGMNQSFINLDDKTIRHKELTEVVSRRFSIKIQLATNMIFCICYIFRSF